MHKIKRLKNNLYYMGQGHILPCFQVCVCVLSNQMLAKLRITGGLVKTDYWTLFPKLEIQRVCIWYRNLRIFISSKFPGDTNAVMQHHVIRHWLLLFSSKCNFLHPIVTWLTHCSIHRSLSSSQGKYSYPSKTITTFKGYSPYYLP